MSEGAKPFGSRTLMGNWQEERAAPPQLTKQQQKEEEDRWKTTSQTSFVPHDVEGRRRQPRPAGIEASEVMLGHGSNQSDWNRREMATVTDLTMGAKKVKPQDAIDETFVVEPTQPVGVNAERTQAKPTDEPAGRKTEAANSMNPVRHNALGNTLNDPMNAIGLRR